MNIQNYPLDGVAEELQKKLKTEIEREAGIQLTFSMYQLGVRDISE